MITTIIYFTMLVVGVLISGFALKDFHNAKKHTLGGNYWMENSNKWKFRFGLMLTLFSVGLLIGKSIYPI